jgi:hypothetical protein
MFRLDNAQAFGGRSRGECSEGKPGVIQGFLTLSGDGLGHLGTAPPLVTLALEHGAFVGVEVGCAHRELALGGLAVQVKPGAHEIPDRDQVSPVPVALRSVGEGALGESAAHGVVMHPGR